MGTGGISSHDCSRERETAMISVEENELLTRVGPDTPMGELLRRYWHPIGGASGLTGKKFTKMVRLLGEDLVLYKDRSGTYGLIEPLCAHRRINLVHAGGQSATPGRGASL